MSQSSDRYVSGVDEIDDEIILTVVDRYEVDHQLTYSTKGKNPELIEHDSGNLGTHLSDIYDDEETKIQKAVNESSKVFNIANKHLQQNY